MSTMLLGTVPNRVRLELGDRVADEINAEWWAKEGGYFDGLLCSRIQDALRCFRWVDGRLYKVTKLPTVWSSSPEVSRVRSHLQKQDRARGSGSIRPHMVPTR
jgi:hypothetical protein